jgi:hypothetical protein
LSDRQYVAETTAWGWLLASLAVLAFVGAVAVTFLVISGRCNSARLLAGLNPGHA